MTNRRTESPTIDCSARTNITLHFNYIENGQGVTDNATLMYYDGSVWSTLDDMPKTLTGCGGQGLWTSRSVSLPASANNNPSVKIAFRWVNNDDGVGTDPSFAVDDITLTVPSAGTPPVANFSSSDTIICVGDCINFTDLSTNTPTSWSWTFTGAATTSSTNQNPAGICYNIAGNYTVELTATNASGSDVETKTSFIQVVALPSVAASATINPICAGDNTDISASGASTYLWDQGLGSGTGFTISPGSNTTYSVTGTDVNGCSNTAQIVVNVNSLPVIGITGTSPVCDGTASVLTGTGGTGYSWSTTQTMNPISVTPSTTTTYTVTGTDGTCSNTASFQVIVNALPVIGINGTSPVCEGDNSVLTGTGGTGYNWSTLETTNPITVSPLITTTYTVTGTDGTCSNTATFQVVVNIVPVASISGSASVCAGETTTLSATGGAGIYTYDWSTAEVTSDIDVSPATNTTYYVTVSAGTCSDSASHTVAVTPLPVIGIAGTGAICNGDNSVLTANGGTGYNWSTLETINPITVNPTLTTTYTVTGTDGTCSNTATFQVQVNSLPSIGISGITSVCEGDNTTLSGTGGTSYIWSTLETTNSILVTPLSTQTYSVTGTDGICSNTASVSVTVNTVPVASVSGDTTVCAGETTILTASGGSGYLWSNSATSASVSVLPLASQYYYVTVSNGSCSDTDSIFVTVNSLPLADAGNDTTVYSGTSANLSGSGGQFYLWSPSDGLSCTDCANPVATPDVTTLYTLVVTDANGCSSSDEVLVTVEYNCGEVFVPNAFSPNGDGFNDIFVVRGNCIETITFRVYDRWGEKVFESQLPGEGWNGEYKGQSVNGGVFSYYYSGTLITGDTFTGKGNVTLMR
jgi:gliding motility-associated-like protein